MANKIVLVDTSILIDYYRKTDKGNSAWITLVRQGFSFAISSVSKYEIYSGATSNQLAFWDNILQVINVIPLNKTVVDTAVGLNISLKRKESNLLGTMLKRQHKQTSK